MVRKFIYIALLIALIVSPRCSRTPLQMSGGASGTEVSACVVSGTAVDSAGRPVPGADVRLRPATYIAQSDSAQYPISSGTISDTITDIFGGYHFRSVSADSYYLEINDHDSIGSLQSFTVFKNDLSKNLANDTLRPMVIISGIIEPWGNQAGNYSVQIFGLERSIRVDSTGRFEVRVPVGTYQLKVQMDSSGQRDLMPVYSMQVGVSLRPGEGRRNIGNFRFGPGPIQPCNGYPCDSIAVRRLLDSAGLAAMSVESVTVEGGGRIVELHLRGLGLSVFPNIMGLSALEYLDIGNNAIAGKLFPLAGAENLRVLIADSNLLTSLDEGIGMLKHLAALTVAHNGLGSLPPSCTNLLTDSLLDLSYNSLCGLDSILVNWSTRYDPDWNSTQKCNGSPALPNSHP